MLILNVYLHLSVVLEYHDSSRSLLSNNKCAGATLVRLLTELLMMRCTNGIDLAYPSRVCLSKTRPRKCLFTSLLTLSTIAFSCFEYERVKSCGVQQRSKNSLINSFAKWDPRSDLIIFGEPKQPK